jgi:hypothetical protein
MKTTKKSMNGTSFHNTVITATVEQLRQILGEPVCEQNDGEDKVNFEWEMETKSGAPFTVYDWKEYRQIDEDEEIEWHIGGHSFIDTEEAAEEIMNKLNKL